MEIGGRPPVAIDDALAPSGLRRTFVVTVGGFALLWHPRMEADPGHRWLRRCVRETCAASGERLGTKLVLA